MDKLVVIALGGNAIIQEGQKGTIEEQLDNVSKSCDQILNLVEEGCKVVLTHGNGPQVGNTLLKVEASKDIVPENPLDVCVAETQGNLGYIIQQSLYNKMKERDIDKEITTVITQVVVDEDDPKFKNPTKPIGPFYKEDEAMVLMEENGILMISDSGRGYRRVVPSPNPIETVENKIIKSLIDNNVIVIAAGGGGIPVVRKEGLLKGVEAVIDKDYASALLAEEIDADFLMILTGVEQVAVNYGTAEEEYLSQLDLEDAKRLLADGQFPPGSMGPKIEACIKFVEKGGKAIITSIDKLQDALEGKTGTRIVKKK